jgi:antitoxin component of MazEF toxin-antitoxin module
VTLKSGALVVRPLARKRRSLESLLKQVTAKNLHDEVATGRSVGKEIW